MNKDLHDTDDFFKSAYEQFEGKPSAEVWERINAGLDKNAADSNRKKFIWWRRAAVFLSLMLAGFVFFDSTFYKKSPARLSETSTTKDNQATRSIIKQEESKISKTASVENENIILKEIGKKENFIKAQNDLTININDITNIRNKNDVSNKNTGDEKVRGKNPGLVKQKITVAITGATEELAGTSAKNEHLKSNKINYVPLIIRDEQVSMFNTLFNIKKPALSGSIVDPIIESSNAKDKKNSKSFIPHWLFSTYVSYDRVNYKLDSDLPNNITSIKHSEDHEPSFSAGVLFTRQVKRRWGVQTGLVYSYNSIGIGPQKLYALQDPAGDIAFKYITSTGYAYIKPGLGIPPSIGDSLNTTEGKHSLQFIRMPLMIKYSFVKDKLTFIPGAGIEANFLTSAKLQTEIEHPLNPEIVFIDKLDGAKPFHLSVVADAEFRYQAGKKLFVSIRPSFRYAISPITENNVVETFPYSFGIAMGLSLKF